MTYTLKVGVHAPESLLFDPVLKYWVHMLRNPVRRPVCFVKRTLFVSVFGWISAGMADLQPVFNLKRLTVKTGLLGGDAPDYLAALTVL